MSETKHTEHSESAGHSEHEVSLNAYIAICARVFVVALIAIGCMIWISFLPGNHSWTFKVALILLVAAFNAFMVAGYLMHLLSEKKLVYTVLMFTVFFVIGLAGLTLWAMQDFPSGTATPLSISAH